MPRDPMRDRVKPICNPNCLCHYGMTWATAATDRQLIADWQLVGGAMPMRVSHAWSREVKRRLASRSTEHERAERVHCQPDDLDLCP